MPDSLNERSLSPPSSDPELVYLSGIQALVQLPILQRQRDEAAGLNTAGFISGYRGSPLGTYDQALWRAKKALAANRITFQPGVNEELAATAVWGTQQVGLFAGARHQGVFGLWYGKGPGADRSMDVFKHANAAGTSLYGGVLAIVGDDHGAKSSTLPHQSDHIFSAAMMPVLNPSGVQDFLDLGLHGWAMSRISGCWVAMRAISDTIETSAAVYVDPHRILVRTPTLSVPAGGLGIRWPDTPLEQELRLQRYKVYAAMDYARLNGINRVEIDSPRARYGIVSTGKSYLDVRQALDALGIDAAQAADIGLRVLKVGMPWPLDAATVRQFAEGLEEILVVEEKRQVIEYQLKEQLYNWREDVRPRVVGKFAETNEWEMPMGEWQLPAAGELTPAMIARVIARRIAPFFSSDRIQQRLRFFDSLEDSLAQPNTSTVRVPHYCSGCPHNSSTKVPEGSRALAGIGCHYMALWLNPEQTQTFSQMGGEGVPWVGQAPFTDTKHVFANLGDGTYAHSGLLAIRQAVAARVPITYKILFNDAVAMTGGQAVEGTLTVPQVVRQVAAEGVERIVVVADDPEKYGKRPDLSVGVRVFHRRELDAVQRDLRDYPGVSVLIYDQVCAAEKRRRRKRELMVDPARRVVINDRVCEGCGDCSRSSNCMSVVPLETEFGRKREIDQSSCNKDFSCVEGFCPSFVTIEGGQLRKGLALEPVGGIGSGGGLAGDGGLGASHEPLEPAHDAELFASLPEPRLPSLEQPYGILVTGVGGTGVVTIGALLGTAAVLEGKGALVLDMAGLAQKGGPVTSHIRIAARQEQLHASRIAAGEANLLIGCDLVVAAGSDALSKLRAGVTCAVVNDDFSVTSDFVRSFAAQASSGDVVATPDPQFPAQDMEARIGQAVGPGNFSHIAATRIATALLGDSIATNLFMVGYAYQKGLIPLSGHSIFLAIEKNGVAVAMNKGAFTWGRRAAIDLDAVEALALPPGALADSRRLSGSLDELIARREQELTAYQSRRYARRYAALVQRVRDAEAKILPGSARLTEAVARSYFKLLAYKDEYEVARLHVHTGFFQRVDAMFEGDYKVVFHLAPPLLSRKDKVTGVPRKIAFGAWMGRVFVILSRMRFLRGSFLDPFAYSRDRKLDRALLAEYEDAIEAVLRNLGDTNHDVAVQLAALPDEIRGFGHIRERYAAHARTHRADLLAKLQGASSPTPPRKGGPAPMPRPRVVMAG
jgi:indolepyruvate ferredoxin oxidoreductase